MRSALARSPSARFSASTTIDLPAPVSPVNTFSPGANSTRRLSMMAKFLMFSSLSMVSRQGQGARTCLQVLPDPCPLFHLHLLRPLEGDPPLSGAPVPSRFFVVFSGAVFIARPLTRPACPVVRRGNPHARFGIEFGYLQQLGHGFAVPAKEQATKPDPVLCLWPRRALLVPERAPVRVKGVLEKTETKIAVSYFGMDIAEVRIFGRRGEDLL